MCYSWFMDLLLKDDIVSLTEFARNTRKQTASLKKSGRPRVLTHNGRAAAVVLSVDHFQKMSEAAHEYEADQRLRAALEAYDKGDEGTPANVVFDRLRTRAATRKKAR